MMKKILYIVLMVAYSFQIEAREQKREMQLSRLQEQFRHPSTGFRPAPLWVWNTDVTTADIDRMLLELKEQGFGGALVHPRPGLVTEYLSPAWFSLWRYALDKGKELGLLIGIYDENSYPSGFAGGHVPNEMPESYNQGQCLVSWANCAMWLLRWASAICVSFARARCLQISQTASPTFRGKRATIMSIVLATMVGAVGQRGFHTSI